MPKFHFSLATLFGGVVVAGVFCAALAQPTETWAMAAISLSVALLLAALLKLLYSERSRRAFWAGFAIFAWGYLLAISLIWPLQGANDSLLITTALLRKLAVATLGEDPTLPLYATGYSAYPTGYTMPANGTYGPLDPYGDSPTAVPTESDPSQAPPAAADDLSAATLKPSGAALSSNAAPVFAPPVALSPPPRQADPFAWQRFMQIGHYFWAILLGLLGGLLASYLQMQTARAAMKSAAKADKPSTPG